MVGALALDKRYIGRRMKKKKASLCLGLFRKISGVYWDSCVKLANLKLAGERQLCERKVSSENKDVCICPELLRMWEIFPWSLVDSLHRQCKVTGKMMRKLFVSLAKANSSFFCSKGLKYFIEWSVLCLPSFFRENQSYIFFFLTSIVCTQTTFWRMITQSLSAWQSL